MTDSSWDFTSLWGSSSLSLSLSEPASRVVAIDVVDIVFKGISIPGCGVRMLMFGEESFAANVEDPKQLMSGSATSLSTPRRFPRYVHFVQEILPADCVVLEISLSATEVSRACG
jgi:hypothetical protein